MMNSPSRSEIKQFANKIFQAGRKRRPGQTAREKAYLLRQARATGNSAAYMPALIEYTRGRLLREILILADAWVKSGWVHGVPLESWVEDDFKQTAFRMSAKIERALSSELDRRPNFIQSGMKQQFNSTVEGAIRIGQIRIKNQRIRICYGCEPEDGEIG